MADTNNQETRQGNMTLYCAGSDLNGFKDKVLDIFGKNAVEAIGDSDSEFQIKLQDGTLVKFSVMAKSQVVMQQNMGMANFFSKAPLKNEKVKSSAIQQIGMFTAIVGITFEVNQDEMRTRVIIGTVHSIAKQILAFVLYPSMELFHPEGKLLISIKGDTSFDEYYPIMSRDMIMSNYEESEFDKARAKKNNDILKNKGLPCPDGMPVSAYEEKSIIPDKETIVKRAVAIFAAAVKSEVVSSGAYDDVDAKLKELMGELEKRYGKFDFLSEEEKAYIDNKNPESSDVNKFGWRYECCAVLLWALNMFELGEPNEICDAAKLGEVIWTNDLQSLVKKSTVRDKKELLDMQDLLHRYDWACVEGRIKKMEIPNLNFEIVVEWHYTLNWLTGVDGVTDWDKVPRNA